MKKVAFSLAGMVICGLLSGCLVRSVEPWLPATTRVATPSLAGAWHDGAQGLTLYFTPGDENVYTLLAVSQGKESAFLTAALHRIDDALLLVVGPAEQQGLGAFTLMPAHLLFRVGWQTNAMQFLAIDMETAGARIEKSPVGKRAAGNKEKGYILLDDTPDLAAFVQAQIKDPAFFNPKPLYQFIRIGGN